MQDNYEQFKERLSNIEETPSPKSWQQIQSQLPKRGLPFKSMTMMGVGLLAALFAMVLLSPNKQKTKQVASQHNSTQTEIELANITLDSPSQSATPSPNRSNPVIANAQQDKTPAQQGNTFAALDTQIEDVAEPTPASQNAQTQETPKKQTKQATTSTNSPKVIVDNNVKVHTSQNKVDTDAPTPDKLYIPNAFTPEGDNNRTFFVPFRELNSFHMKIFSRNGMQVFETKDITAAWDGTIKGQKAQAGVYAVMIKYTTPDGVSHTQTGQLHLIR